MRNAPLFTISLTSAEPAVIRRRPTAPGSLPHTGAAQRPQARKLGTWYLRYQVPIREPALRRGHCETLAQASGSLGSGLVRLIEQCPCFGERWLVAHRCEQVSRFAERLVSGGVVECMEAAALSEEGVGAFGEVAEQVPPLGGVGVKHGGFAAVAGCFGELGAAACEGVLLERGERGDAVGEAGGEGLVVGCNGGADEAGQHGGVGRVGAGGAEAVDLVEQEPDLSGVSLGVDEGGGVGGRADDPLRGAGVAGRVEHRLGAWCLAVPALLRE